MVKTLLISFMGYISTQLSREGFPKIHAGASAPPHVAVTHSLSSLCPTRHTQRARTTGTSLSEARLHQCSWPLQFLFSVFSTAIYALCPFLWGIHCHWIPSCLSLGHWIVKLCSHTHSLKYNSVLFPLHYPQSPEPAPAARLHSTAHNSSHFGTTRVHHSSFPAVLCPKYFRSTWLVETFGRGGLW